MGKARRPRTDGKAKGKPRGVSKPFTPEQRRTFLQLMSVGMHQSPAACQVGVSPQCISNLKRDDAEFAAEVSRVEATAEFNLLAILARAAPKDPKVAMWLLERRWPERWAKAEVRASLSLSQIDTGELAIAIQASLRIVARSHADWDLPDVDAEKPAAAEDAE